MSTITAPRTATARRRSTSESTSGSPSESSTTSPSAVPVHVVRTDQVSPNLRRVTLAGEALRTAPALGLDQYLRLLLPRPGQDRPVLPVSEHWWPEMQAMPERTRPVLRNYTVRAARPELGEIDVDLVLHGDDDGGASGGPGSRWAARARVGDEVGVIIQGTTFAPPATAEHVLVVGDETALPAVAGIVEALAQERSTTATVLLQVPTRADVQDLPTAPGIDVSWRTPDDPGSLLEDVTGTRLPARCLYAWVAGECSVVTSVRRHLVRERGVPKQDVCFCGYWRADGPAYDD